MGRKPGTKITYTPGQTARYRSQWLRAQRGARVEVERVDDKTFHCLSHRSVSGFWTVKAPSAGRGANDAFPLALYPLQPLLPPIGNPITSRTTRYLVTQNRYIGHSISQLDTLLYPTSPPLNVVNDNPTGASDIISSQSVSRTYARTRLPYTFDGLLRRSDGSYVFERSYVLGVWSFVEPGNSYGVWGIVTLVIAFYITPTSNGTDPGAGSPGPAVPFSYPVATPPDGEGNRRYSCDCPDYTRKQLATGRFPSETVSRDWSGSNAGSGIVAGSQQPCKHILQVKQLLGEPVDAQPGDWNEMLDWKAYNRKIARQRARTRAQRRQAAIDRMRQARRNLAARDRAIDQMGRLPRRQRRRYQRSKLSPAQLQRQRMINRDVNQYFEPDNYRYE